MKIDYLSDQIDHLIRTYEKENEKYRENLKLGKENLTNLRKLKIKIKKLYELESNKPIAVFHEGIYSSVKKDNSCLWFDQKAEFKDVTEVGDFQFQPGLSDYNTTIEFHVKNYAFLSDMGLCIPAKREVIFFLRPQDKIFIGEEAVNKKIKEYGLDGEKNKYTVETIRNLQNGMAVLK